MYRKLRLVIAMDSIITAVLAFICVFGGALLGMHLRSRLPESHLDQKSSDIVKLGMGLTGTMAALLLSLLLASAKASFDTLSNEFTDVSSKIILLDRTLAHYGPETQYVRERLRKSATMLLMGMQPSGQKPRGPQDGTRDRELLYDGIQGLAPSTDDQRFAKAHALDIAFAVGQTRWLMVEQRTNSVARPLLIVLVCWLTIIFISFGLFAPRNATVICTLFVCASSISGAIFLLLELYTPFTGVIQISNEPLRNAIAYLGQ